MKKILKIFAIVIIFFVSIYAVYALTTIDNENEFVEITVKKPTNDAGSYEFNTEDSNDGNIGTLKLNAKSGYYVKSISVTFNNQELDLGFVAGSEHGNFIRKYKYSPDRDEYQFEIPEEASNSNKVKVEIEFERKSPIDITYQQYSEEEYSESKAFELESYGSSEILVENYMDGDIVLPENCTKKGCLLNFQFSEENYDVYKSMITTRDAEKTDEQLLEEREPWFRAEARYKSENEEIETLFTKEQACDDESFSCNIIVKKDFDKASYGKLHMGYTDLHIYSKNFIGFSVKTDVDNFNDLLYETGGDLLGFSEEREESSAEIFYGTKKLALTKVTANAIVNEGEDNTESLRDFDSVIGSGYGYETSYNNGVLTVDIDSYYQDQLVLNLTVKNGNQVLLPANVVLHRLAFAGNGGELLEVDEFGRNCAENNNSNTCNEGRYYSTQYRGVLSSFYIKEENLGDPVSINSTNERSVYRIENIDEENKTITLSEPINESGYARNKDFNPHAITFFYNNDDMIVETKDFDLNEDVDASGCMAKQNFDLAYDGYNVNVNLNNNDYVCTDHEHGVPLKYIDYFGPHKEESIMHDIVFIGKDLANQKGITKIAVFLVNGEVKKTDAPALTYGVGEGIVMKIHKSYGGAE